jgi:hypothetical protein
MGSTLTTHFDFVTARDQPEVNFIRLPVALREKSWFRHIGPLRVEFVVSGLGHFRRQWRGRGDVGRMSVIRHKRWIAVALMMSALAVSGCTSSIADLPLVGTPSDAPERPKDPSASYLPVNDLPPARDEQVLDPKERAKIQAELTAARDRQAIVLPPQNGQSNVSQGASQGQGSSQAQSQGSK